MREPATGPTSRASRPGSTGSGSSLVVSGYVHGAENLLTRYRRNCRARGIDAAGSEPRRFRLEVPVQGSAARARHCNLAISRRLQPSSGRARKAQVGGPRGRVRVIACADGLCIERRLRVEPGRAPLLPRPEQAPRAAIVPAG